jgi:hypothetical protein
LNQLKSSVDSGDDVLKALEEDSRFNQELKNQPNSQKGDYDISDDEGSSGSGENKQPVDLDDASKVVYN